MAADITAAERTARTITKTTAAKQAAPDTARIMEPFTITGRCTAIKQLPPCRL